MLKDKLKKLAELRIVEEELKAYAEKSFDAVQELPEWKLYQEDKEEVDYIKEQIDELRAEINELTIQEYIVSGEKKPAPGVGIRVYTVLNYDEAEALEYCRNNLTPALRLDKRTFEKIAKDSNFSFVEYEEEPRATIASDLSEYLDDNG